MAVKLQRAMQQLRWPKRLTDNVLHRLCNTAVTAVTCQFQPLLLRLPLNGGVAPISTQIQNSGEAQEIQAVLSSEAFSNSPNLSNLLRYLCDNYLADRKVNLNEYRIGVEALGRPADFDPSKNSSVRVEVHRLRAKLRQYYEFEGRNHPLRIILEDGHYGIQVVRREDKLPSYTNEPQELKGLDAARAEPSASRDPVDAKLPKSVDVVERPRRFRIPNVATPGLAIAAGVVVVALIVWMWLGTPRFGRSARTLAVAPANVTVAPTAAAAGSGDVLILAGYQKGKYIDRTGRVWGGDRYFTGGEAAEEKFPFIQGTADPTMFSTARIGEFSYNIPVKPGFYELRLHFAETTFGPGTVAGKGEGSRVFSVFLGDHAILSDFDVLSEAGGNNQALTRVFRDVAPAADGKIHLTFRQEADHPLVNAIELIPAPRGSINPIRIVMQEGPYVDRAGHLWEPDQYFKGGVLAANQSSRINSEDSGDPHLFDRERFGRFSYQIPVPPGHYTVTLYFAETYFGTDGPVPPEGSPRIFDVYANEAPLLRNFDILKEAGGPNRPLIKTFHGIEPNAAGQIVLDFLPVKNYACVDAIEVTDESH
jgi:hypothetical protein